MLMIEDGEAKDIYEGNINNRIKNVSLLGRVKPVICRIEIKDQVELDFSRDRGPGSAKILGREFSRSHGDFSGTENFIVTWAKFNSIAIDKKKHGC